ncbi:uncharacterized protein C8A04DRAFT_10523 [Dichotomopilus funicola]|uniref:Uncharacterized protein n=1 Tax=Dichotomopilus funicola TaxID=1934379 RepID=A0AAN6V6U9_9PEZI|nr:hypothetical protein C8A04DRAFT_10523 [Dichotomopilus funicola]
MTLSIPRMQVFEIADYSWYPGFLRGYLQAALTAAWTINIPFIQTSSPAEVVARLLRTHLGRNLHAHTFIDFCAGAGGPTPFIERHLNSLTPSPPSPNTNDTRKHPLQFVLTDLHPHPSLWAAAAARSPNLSYIAEPVDAARVPREVIRKYRGGGRPGEEGKRVFRLFNVSFHHFDDGLARAILRDTVDGGGEGFGIFELQDRGLAGFLSVCLFGIGSLIAVPYYAVLWRAPLALVFTYLVPIFPVALVFDGWMSCLRTRTPDEVEALLRTCGAEGGEKEIAKWEVKSGSETFMWPVGRVNWVIAVKKDDGGRD